MAQLRHDYAEFVKRDVEVVVVGPEDAGAFADYWQKESLPFVGLPDPTHSVLKLYGQEVKLFKLGRMPAQVLIDKAGVARFVHYGHDMKDIPGNEEILALADAVNAPADAPAGSDVGDDQAGADDHWRKHRDT
jgi:peroxiredoxin Q/BCP